MICARLHAADFHAHTRKLLPSRLFRSCCGGTFTLSGLRGWPDKTAQAAWTTQPTPQDATPYASNSVQVVCPYVTDEGCGIVFQVDTYCSSGHCSFNSQNVQAVVLCKITPGIAPPFCEVVSPAAGVPTQDSLPFFGATVTNSFYETDYSATVMVQLWGYDQGRKV